MDFRNMSDIDLKLHLLSGEGIRLDALFVEPYTLREVRSIGYENYMSCLQWLSVSVDDFIKSTEDLEKRIILETQRSKLKSFDFFTRLGSPELRSVLGEVLATVFKTEDIRMMESGAIGIDFGKLGIITTDAEGNDILDAAKLEALPDETVRLVHRENFDDLIRIVKYQNYLSTVRGHEFNPANEEARKLAEQMERNRQRVEAKKKTQQINEKGEDGETDITDIISAVTAKSNSISKLNVWDLSLYQLYDEYSRLELIDNYDFSVRAMVAGAKEIDLKHWSSRI